MKLFLTNFYGDKKFGKAAKVTTIKEFDFNLMSAPLLNFYKRNIH